MAKKKNKSVDLKLELIGGVFAVETFEDGKESRTELPGDAILNLVLDAVTQALEKTFTEAKRKAKSK